MFTHTGCLILVLVWSWCTRMACIAITHTSWPHQIKYQGTNVREHKSIINKLISIDILNAYITHQQRMCVCVLQRIRHTHTHKTGHVKGIQCVCVCVCDNGSQCWWQSDAVCCQIKAWIWGIWVANMENMRWVAGQPSCVQSTHTWLLGISNENIEYLLCLVVIAIIMIVLSSRSSHNNSCCCSWCRGEVTSPLPA